MRYQYKNIFDENNKPLTVEVDEVRLNSIKSNMIKNIEVLRDFAKNTSTQIKKHESISDLT